MKAGKLNRPIVFQRNNGTKDNMQNKQENWVYDFDDRANFAGLGSAEFPVNWQRFSESSARFSIRFRQDIDPALHRIVLVDDRFSPAKTHTWDIFPPYDPDGKMRELFIEAKEVRGTTA